MNYQSVKTIGDSSNAWELRFNPKYEDFSIRTTAGKINMSVEDDAITIAVVGIGYVTPYECITIGEALKEAGQAAEQFQTIIDDYRNVGLNFSAIQ